MEIKGIIKQVAREGKAVLLDNDQWYSHFSATTQFQVGDAVKITYTDKVKGDVTYHNWTLIEPADAPVEVVKPGQIGIGSPNDAYKKLEIHKPNGNGSMYASYAKDVFNHIYDNVNDRGKEIDCMNIAIELVKQAKEAFE